MVQKVLLRTELVSGNIAVNKSILIKLIRH